jgi:tetratricopeptide (TPR) repeat protein
MFPVFSVRRLMVLLSIVFAAAVLASPAVAQTTGGVKGRVTDEKGQGIQDCKIIIEFKEMAVAPKETKTDRKGEFVQIGLQPGQYRVSAQKGDLGQTFDLKVKLGDPTDVRFRLQPGMKAAPNKEELAKNAAVQGAFNEGVTAMGANDLDTAIAKFKEAGGLLPSCYECFSNLGQAHLQKKEYAEAEAAFNKAIEIKPDYAPPYNGLTTVYNAQKKFDEAQKASQKAIELAATASGPGGGGGNVNALYNQGVIAWNANKPEEAKAKFEEALKLDPNHADSHYQLGMTLLNMGKMTEAGAEFQAYLKLAPTGQYAAQAQAMVKQLIK